MAHNKIPVTKAKGSLGGRNRSEDGICAIIAGGVAVTGGAQLGTAYELSAIEDLEALGIDAAYDIANKVLVHHHVDRIYKRNPNATVHFMLTPQNVTMANMLDPAAGTPYAYNLVRASGEKQIKMLGVCLNPATGYTPTLSGGLDAQVIAAFPKAQALVSTLEQEYIFLDAVVLEGKQFNGTAGSATDVRSLEAPNVSVTILQDPDVAVLDALFAKYAAVGDVVGLLSANPVSRNIGENSEDMNLQNKGLGLFVSGINLSSGLSVTTYAPSSLTALNTKGYIFGEPVSPLTGFRLNDSHTAALVETDYGYIENNRVINKAIRLARRALLPVVNARLRADTENGKLDPAEEEGLKSIAVDSVDVLERDGDISGDIEAAINPGNPDYDLLAGDDIEVVLTFVPMIIGRTIKLKIGFKNPKKNS